MRPWPQQPNPPVSGQPAGDPAWPISPKSNLQNEFQSIQRWRTALGLHRSWIEGRQEGQRLECEGLEIEHLHEPMALLERAWLRGLNAPAADLKLARMAGAEFELCRIPFANLSSADLTRSLWIRCSLNDASLASANLCEAIFQTTAFNNARAPGSRWMESRLSRCDFTGTALPQAAFHHAILLECRFAESNLQETLWYHARLQFMRLERATLRFANFTRAILECTDLLHCDATGSKWNHASLSGAFMAKSIFRNADFRSAQLRGARFAGSLFEGARFQGASTFGSDFRGANLMGAAGFTPRQLMQARTDPDTILPDGSRGPFLLYSGAEKPIHGVAAAPEV